MGAQDRSKYLEGAVPEVNGKVVFSKIIPVNNPISEPELFNLMNKWAEENYNGSDNSNRVLLSSLEDKDIACLGEMNLVFRKSLLILDQAQMSYQLIISIGQNKCDVAVRNIRYQYTDYKTPVAAEELISDELAFNKKKGKLNRYYDKFRIHTVDSINNIFNSIDLYLNGKVTVTGGAVAQNAAGSQPVQSQPVVQERKNASGVTSAGGPILSIPGFKKVSADKIPANMSNNQSLVLTGAVDKPTVIAASWGGTSTLLDKLMGLSTIQQSSKVINNDQTYTISFYTEIYSDAIKELNNTGGSIKDKIEKAGLTPVTTPSGAPAFSEAWMIIECKKAGEMPSSGSDKTYLGEILNVWIK